MGSVNNNWLMPGHSGKSCCHENINLKMKPTADRCLSMKRFLDCETIGEYSRPMTSNSHVLASCKGSRQAMLAPFCHPDSLFILSCSFFFAAFSRFLSFLSYLYRRKRQWTLLHLNCTRHCKQVNLMHCSRWHEIFTLLYLNCTRHCKQVNLMHCILA